MDEKTVIRAHLYLDFDNETDTAFVKDQIGILSADCIDKKSRRKSPFKDDNLPGSWSVVTETIETYELEDVTKMLLEIINPYLDKIKNMLDSYDGKAVFLIVTEMVDNTPALCFNREFLEVVEYLRAEIAIDMYAELVGVDYCH